MMSSSQPTKKKRNLPGMPDPEAEVIALSPKSLLATNRFICEICNKGFQRDQNLQLHRRGHNLPWKLRKGTNNKEIVRKKVYVCPEITCVHHDPKRALGDLTGIKKHFFRKHGEKKWKCERCSKNYAVQCDWKAHMKSCGTREYRCHCTTLFSRRDNFNTHRTFCDALASSSSPHLSSALTIQRSDQIGFLQQPSSRTTTTLQMHVLNPTPPAPVTAFEMFRTGSMYSGQYNNIQPQSQQPGPAMSATALLQKAAQVGAAGGGGASSSFLCGFDQPENSQRGNNNIRFPSAAGGEGGFESMGPILNLFCTGSKPMTLDLLGMGIGSVDNIDDERRR
ncbi:zinc finger protein GAI-ASSOCIATED FACTOR 1-like [Impatiens glandulifera]|uniref:zinc finger protein GAI-ASSOCIATED FACTOR 1-like n=1 Tax=Impatiens glandulifera TaxID=253017 RepID=UPI001FB0FABD|nr:zinc finger protein GAI-ASSOCIATED FACTOR 1-like [Impatiens glandulifera]